MTKNEKLILQGTDPTFLDRDQIAGLSRDQIAGLSRDQIARLSGDQIAWLSRDQIARLSRDQIARLSRDQIAGLSRDQIAKIEARKKEFFWDKPYTQLLKAIKQQGNSLDMATWHSCETTHCIGGWTVTLAPNGKKLEAEMGTGPAARAILLTSRPGVPLPRFDSEAPEDAIMAFVEARALEEAA